MPELPDITIYKESLARQLIGQTLESCLVRSPFVLRTVTPPLASLVGSRVVGAERIGKRLVIEFDGDRFVVLHLMVAGRLRWLAPTAKSPARIVLAEFAFPGGRLVLTEAAKKKRASLHVVEGRGALREFDRGGLDVRGVTTTGFAARLRSENHTLKRALTDPRLFDGIGNAYSDEILHRARLSPLLLTSRITDGDAERLHGACIAVLDEWTQRLRNESGGGWPQKVTAFREGMAVHGRFRLPCPVCASPVQRIRYADNETNYCATCQTNGRLLADRGLSRLLKEDWPRSIDEYDGHIGRRLEVGGSERG
jgi:formamidopyrimidine-DNA glycosylase